MNNVNARSVQFAGERPVSRIYAQSKIVIPDKDFVADSPVTAPLARFQGGGRAHALAGLKERWVASDKFDPSTATGSSKEKRFVMWTADELNTPAKSGKSSS